MKWETRCNTPPLFSLVYGPVFTSLCIISQHCNASESNFKENLDIQDILIHQKSSHLVNSRLLAYATSVELWDNMASLQWWFRLEGWSEILEWLTCWNYEFTNIMIFQKCKICRKKGDDSALLLCDECNQAFHMHCLRPALFHIPKGDWLCPACDVSTAHYLVFWEYRLMLNECYILWGVILQMYIQKIVHLIKSIFLCSQIILEDGFEIYPKITIYPTQTMKQVWVKVAS